jgi:hypothetical protein
VRWDCRRAPRGPPPSRTELRCVGGRDLRQALNCKMCFTSRVSHRPGLPDDFTTGRAAPSGIRACSQRNIAAPPNGLRCDRQSRRSHHDASSPGIHHHRGAAGAVGRHRARERQPCRRRSSGSFARASYTYAIVDWHLVLIDDSHRVQDVIHVNHRQASPSSRCGSSVAGRMCRSAPDVQSTRRARERAAEARNG